MYPATKALSFDTIHKFLYSLVYAPFWKSPTVIHKLLYSLVYAPFWISPTVYYAIQFGEKYTSVCCHISSCNVCHWKRRLILFVRWNEFIFLLWIQWQEERKQESFLKLVSATRNLQFVGRLCVWFSVCYGYTLMSIFHLTIQYVFWQNNKMWMPGHCRMLNHTVRPIHCWLCFVTSHVAKWDVTELVLESHLHSVPCSPSHISCYPIPSHFNLSV
jgi:hypothetical protein